MPKLIKSLKDGSINRDVICETIMMSEDGLSILKEISNSHSRDPLVLRSCIKALKKSDQTLIDDCLEYSLKH
jgi:hypothetical protein